MNSGGRMAFDTTATAAVDRLHRMRGAAIAAEYTCLAGLDRGYRTIWSGRPGVWLRGRVIDLGRRPDTSRPPRPQDQPAGTGDDRPADLVIRDIKRYFFKRGNQPASIADVAAAIGLTYTGTYAYLRRADLFQCVRKGGGPVISLYVARVAEDVPAESVAELQLATLTPAGRRMVAALRDQAEPLRSNLLADAAGVSMPIVRRYVRECPGVFMVDRRRELVGVRVYEVLYISLQPEILKSLNGGPSDD